MAICLITGEEISNGNGWNDEKNMSANAVMELEDGHVMRSGITRKWLDSYGFKYSVEFARWLIANRYWLPCSKHHVGNRYTMVEFFSLDTYKFEREQSDLFMQKFFLFTREKEEGRKGEVCIVHSFEMKEKKIGHKGFLRAFCRDSSKGLKFYFDYECKKPITKKEYGDVSAIHFGDWTPQITRFVQERVR